MKIIKCMIKKYILIALALFMLPAGLLTSCIDRKDDLAGNSKSLRRLDEDGYLYYLDYTKDYYGLEAMAALREFGYIETGCTCRNYDYPHRVSKEDRTLTGLNIILHCKPEGKYESIAVADATWIGPNDPMFQRGGPDLAGFDLDKLAVLPYQCMDGINEKGLCVSILRVDIKEGDQPAKYPIGSSMMLRYMLDDCANVDEAIQKTKTGILVPEDWQNCHFMVSDSTGQCMVIESRNGELSIIPSEICTNFYLGSDDIEDYYQNGTLREEAVKIIDEAIASKYHYGYGHGYHRFVTILGQLDRYRDTKKEEYYTRMPESSALTILQSVAQNQYTNASGISMTQYSAIYNNEKKTVEVWPFQNYFKSYKFDVKGKEK